MADQKCGHVRLYSSDWRGASEYPSCLLCQVESLERVLKESEGKLQEALKDAAHFTDMADQANVACLRIEAERDSYASRLDTEMKRTADATWLATDRSARVRHVEGMLEKCEAERDELRGRWNECRDTGQRVDDQLIETQRRLGERELLLREIVAYFDVLHSKYRIDKTPCDLDNEWPYDWLRRAIENLSPDVVEKHSTSSDACPLCGRTDAHSHASGPLGMS